MIRSPLTNPYLLILPGFLLAAFIILWPLYQLGTISLNDVNRFGRHLESVSVMTMLDMGAYGGGRARNDYALYQVNDIKLTPSGYWVISGDKRKADRVHANTNKYIGRSPFFVANP